VTTTLEFTLLGSGSSGGVPRADGNWGVCDPAEPRNRRNRCSLMVRRLADAPPEAQTTVVIDTSPEFRIQTAAAGAKRLDAVLMTHDHADQSHGLDDIRAFALKQRARIDCWMDAATRATLTRRFDYIFDGEGIYPAIATVRDIPPHGEAWSVEGPSGGIPIRTFDQDHGGVRSVGYRLGRLAYSSDVVGLPDSATEALSGLDIWIVDALRMAPHPTHAHLALALEWIERFRPKRAILTNMHIDMDYATLARTLPPGVEAGYDGLRFTLEVPDGNDG
jgi:phosphoribosyl 1,2-cyclic phosphate phosphodiesterase